MHPRIALSALLLASLLTTAPGRALADLASAASLAGGAANTPGVAAAGSPVFYSVSATTDGEGGALYVWEDSRPGDPTSVTDIYAGRVGRFGTIWWSGAAVPVCVAYGGQRAPSIVSDGTRGAFIAWISSGFAESVYVQHIDASGAALWATNGVLVSKYSYDGRPPAMAPDGAGGVIIACSDIRLGGSPVHPHIYAQRIGADGTIQWPVNGVPICTASGQQSGPKLISDGSGGAFIAWNDNRTSGAYAQRINSTGTSQWTADGVPVVAIAWPQNVQAIFPDGGGGVVVTCVERQASPSAYVMRVQRMDANGVAVWAADGIAPCDVAYSFDYLGVAASAPGEEILVWRDPTRGYGIYGQHVAVDGSVTWGSSGTLLLASGYGFAQGDGYGFAIQPDGVGGAFFASQRNVDYLSKRAAAGIQHVDASGALLWGPTGIELPNTADWLDLPSPVADGAGGAIFLWGDHTRYCGMHPPCNITPTIKEYAGNYDGAGNQEWLVFAQPSDGVVSAGHEPIARLSLSVEGRSPSVGAARLRFGLPERAHVRLALYDIAGRLVARLVDGEMPAGEHTVTWNGALANRGNGAGVYFARMQVGAESLAQRIVMLE